MPKLVCAPSVCAPSDGHLRLRPAKPRLQSSIGGRLIRRTAMRLRPSLALAGLIRVPLVRLQILLACRIFATLGSRTVGRDAARRLALEQIRLTAVHNF